MKILIVFVLACIFVSCSSNEEQSRMQKLIKYQDSVIAAKDSIIVVKTTRITYLQNVGDSLLAETVTYSSVCLRVLGYIDIVKGNPAKIKYLTGWSRDSFGPYLTKTKLK